MSEISRHTPIVETPLIAPVPSGLTRLVWSDEQATQRFAAQLAAKPALSHAFIALHGDLGAGKTTLVRHLLHVLGVQGRIKSPTYAVVESYELADDEGGLGHSALNIWHFDFYRFNDPQEWEDAGFRDIFASAGLKIAEWPDKAAAMLPTADLDIHILTTLDGTRQVSLTANTAVGESLL